MSRGAAPVRLWLQPLDRVWEEVAALGLDWLSDDEHVRLAGIGSERSRQRFLAGHWLAREAIAGHAGGLARDWRLENPDKGKPVAVHRDGHAGPAFSLSHSGHWLGCAVGPEPMGLDLEQPTRARDVLALARLACSDAERALLEALDDAPRTECFYRLWTLKEAWAKRDGRGIAPVRLRATTFEASPPDAAVARTWQGEGLWVALAAGQGTHVELPSEPALAETGAWRPG